MNSKLFYDTHINFSLRSLLEHEISPGIKCKFDLILENLNINQRYRKGLDVGCSGNSFLYFLKNVRNKSFLDISAIPLRQYISKSKNLIDNKTYTRSVHPMCGDICHLPYANESFDIITILDTLEHIKNDEKAVLEISRVLNQKGVCIITVPHRRDFYTIQDQLIGHYRRYEIEQILKMFDENHLRCLRYFNVYGKLMKFVFFQTLNPRKTEETIINLRLKYRNNLLFKLFWKIVVKLISKLMKIDAKYHKLEKGMNLCFIFEKV